LARRVVAPATDGAAGLAILHAVSAAGGTVVGAVTEGVIVGAAVAASDRVEPGRDRLLALGLAPGLRRQGIGRALLATLVERDRPLVASVTLAERDPVEPLERPLRAQIARRLLEGSGFRIEAVSDDSARIDPDALTAVRD
jgi:GNAT superfamily N-acetyltransferase